VALVCRSGDILDEVGIDGSGNARTAMTYAVKSISARNKHLAKTPGWSTVSGAIETIGFALALERQWAPAAVLTAFADANVDPSNGTFRWPRREMERERLATRLRDKLGADELRRKVEEGAQMSRCDGLARRNFNPR
jgi:hypothetical protein